eukprot:2028611-Amphidinium_carterae.1
MRTQGSLGPCPSLENHNAKTCHKCRSRYWNRKKQSLLTIWIENPRAIKWDCVFTCKCCMWLCEATNNHPTPLPIVGRFFRAENVPLAFREVVVCCSVA